MSLHVHTSHLSHTSPEVNICKLFSGTWLADTFDWKNSEFLQLEVLAFGDPSKIFPFRRGRDEKGRGIVRAAALSQELLGKHKKTVLTWSRPETGLDPWKPALES